MLKLQQIIDRNCADGNIILTEQIKQLIKPLDCSNYNFIVKSCEEKRQSKMVKTIVNYINYSNHEDSFSFTLGMYCQILIVLEKMKKEEAENWKVNNQMTYQTTGLKQELVSRAWKSHRWYFQFLEELIQEYAKEQNEILLGTRKPFNQIELEINKEQEKEKSKKLNAFDKLKNLLRRN